MTATERPTAQAEEPSNGLCDTLQCAGRGVNVLVVQVDGVIGGRFWEAGDRINVCFPCFRAIKLGRDPLKEP